ncbi:MAG TPA: alpha/beta hydrolase [Candidatus Nanopelagicaceae bacterium]|nr:alpha/beta hydrolase [Candidatus Nanopelagicaceae bacterium]
MADEPAPREWRVPTAEVALSVREWAGPGRPILCLHGLASNARWWDGVAGFLSPPHRVLAADLRGHGRSDRPERGYGFPEVAGDLGLLISQLELSRPVVVGHSWGASVALWLAGLLDEVAGVVCVDGGAADLRSIFGGSWQVARERMRPPHLEHLDPARVGHFVAASAISQEIGVEAATKAMMGNFERDAEGWLQPRLDLERHLEIAKALYELDQEELWSRVSCPVLFLMAGAADREAKEVDLERACHALAGPAEARFIDGQHDLPLQHPRAVAEEVARFAAGLPRAPHSRG